MQIEDWIVHDIPDHMIQAASDWIIQLDHLEQRDSSLSQPQKTHLRLQFEQWLNADPLHQMAFLQFSELWAKSSTLQHVEHLLEHSEVLSFPDLQASLPRARESQSAVFASAEALAAPSWMYKVVIGFITLGCTVPLLF